MMNVSSVGLNSSFDDALCIVQGNPALVEYYENEQRKVEEAMLLHDYGKGASALTEDNRYRMTEDEYYGEPESIGLASGEVYA